MNAPMPPKSRRKRKRLHWEQRLGVALLVLVCGFLVLGQFPAAFKAVLLPVVELFTAGWDRADVAATETRGTQIVTALWAHHADHGVFPDSLEALTPHYLAEIPQPLTGHKKWLYTPRGVKFELRFSADRSKYPSAWITDIDKSWNYDQ